MLLNGAEPMTEYLVEALQRCSPHVTRHILHALGAVLYENSGRLVKVGQQRLCLPVKKDTHVHPFLDTI